MSVHKSGWLDKLSSAKGLFENKRNRFFVLYDNILKYYVKPDDAEAKGEVPIGKDTVIDLHHGRHKFAFSIESSSTERELVLLAPSEVAMHEWMHALQARVENAAEVAESYDEFGSGGSSKRPSIFGRRSTLGGPSVVSERRNSVSTSSPVSHMNLTSFTPSTMAPSTASMFGLSFAGGHPRDSGSISSAQALVVSEADRDFAVNLAEGDDEIFVRWIKKASADL